MTRSVRNEQKQLAYPAHSSASPTCSIRCSPCSVAPRRVLHLEPLHQFGRGERSSRAGSERGTSCAASDRSVCVLRCSASRRCSTRPRCSGMTGSRSERTSRRGSTRLPRLASNAGTVCTAPELAREASTSSNSSAGRSPSSSHHVLPTSPRPPLTLLNLHPRLHPLRSSLPLLLLNRSEPALLLPRPFLPRLVRPPTTPARRERERAQQAPF